MLVLDCIKLCLFKLQLHCLEKNGKQSTKMVSYCAYHRYAAVFMHLSLLIFSQTVKYRQLPVLVFIFMVAVFFSFFFCGG